MHTLFPILSPLMYVDSSKFGIIMVVSRAAFGYVIIDYQLSVVHCKLITIATSLLKASWYMNM